MLNAIVEMFMSQYFLFKAVLGKYLTNSKELFRALSRICLIPKANTDKLYELAENEIAKHITTEKEYMQHQRMQKYSKLVGSAQKINPEWEEIIRIKGNAILIAHSYNLVLDADASRNVVYTLLSSAATGGTVLAMQMMGILQCEGIFLDKNEKVGLKNLSKAADWNDSMSVLALLHYRKENRAYNMARLRQVIEDTPFSCLYDIATEQYGFDNDLEVGEVKLLYKAFASGVLKREAYDPKYARILNSKALYIKDKEKAVFSQNKEQLSVIGDLPLKLAQESITAVEVSAVRQIAIKREAETAAVIQALKNSDLRALPSYRPLCLCCESKYILSLYANAIATKNKTTHIEMIDVGELNDYDFEPTPNNIFVRSIDEDRDNRFLMFFYGEISEKKMDTVKSILQSSRRSKFHLNSPNVTLNLGAILPICFCDKRNVSLLKPYCDVITLTAVNTDELTAVIKDIFISKEKTYGTGEIKLNEEAVEVFRGYDIDTAEKLIDAAVRARRENGTEITLTRDILREYASDSDRPRIGFGGYVNGKNH